MSAMTTAKAPETPSPSKSKVLTVVVSVVAQAKDGHMMTHAEATALRGRLEGNFVLQLNSGFHEDGYLFDAK